MTRKRWLGLLVAALLVPLPAFALSGGSAGAAALDVSVSNAGCGIGGGSSVVCRLQVSFNAIDGASSYTASVAGPDGSVVDYGAIGAGGATIPVPYTGNGTYSVSVSAWGKDTNRHHGKPLATDSTGHVKNATASVQASAGTRGRDVARRHAHGTVSKADATRNADVGGHASATVDSGSTSTTSQQTCTPIPAPSSPPPTTTTTGDGTTTTTTTTTAPPSGQLQAQPPPSDCPNPQQGPDGPCCPSP